MAKIEVEQADYERLLALLACCTTVIADPDKRVGESTRVDVHEPERTRLRREADFLDTQKRAFTLTQHLAPLLKEKP